jgi:MFS family permease
VSVDGAAGHVEVRTPRRAWLIWGIAVAAYAVAVFHRGSLGVSGVAAQHRFGATAAVLSLFGVLQLAVYAALQVPVGALLDRVGSRRMIATGAAVMAVGQLVMASTHSIAFAVLARVLVGAGDAMTFTSVLRLVALWFAPRRVPLLSQVTGLLGQLGQIAAAYPLVALLRDVGWSSAFTLAGVVGLVVSVVVALTLRDIPAGTAVASAPVGWGDMRALLVDAWREPGTRLGLWIHFVTQFSGTVFVLLWGYPFLVVGEGRSPAEAGALLTVLVAVSMVVGPVLGQLVGRWPYRRSVPVLAIVLSSATVWAVVLLWPGRAPLALLVVLVLVLGANGPGSMVGFDFARTENPPARIGSATGIVNVGGFVASLLTILLVGLVLDLSSGGTSYTLSDFKLALSVQYLFWALGLVAVLRARRRLKASRGIVLDPFHRAVVRVARNGRRR